MAKPCQSQSVQVSEQHYPNGVYSCHQKGFTAAYDQGCVVEFSSVGLVLSAQESQQLAKADDPTVPEGFIAVMHRSAVWNYVQHLCSNLALRCFSMSGLTIS